MPSENEFHTASGIFFYFSYFMPSDQRYISKSDTELHALYKQSGDLAIVGELYNRYMSMVYGVSLKYLKDRDESKDAVMQLFEKLVETLKNHEVANFKSWLYVMAKNHCLMVIRARKGKNFEEISPFLMESDALTHQDAEPEMESNLSKLEKCMETLVNEQKHCVQLFYLQQKCYREISDLTGFDDNKVKSYIQNGKRNLKICMERNG
jgi:RNA polymerase sigma factor (sigma-70 family)